MSENDTIQKKSKSQINKAVFFTSALEGANKFLI
ncbi:hypothetical protein ENCLCP370B_15765 [Enterobacter cloacae]